MVSFKVMVMAMVINHQKDLQRIIKQEQKILDSIKVQYWVRLIVIVIIIQKEIVISIGIVEEIIVAKQQDFMIIFQINLVIIKLSRVMVFSSIIVGYLVVVTFKI